MPFNFAVSAIGKLTVAEGFHCSGKAWAWSDLEERKEPKKRKIGFLRQRGGVLWHLPPLLVYFFFGGGDKDHGDGVRDGDTDGGGGGAAGLIITPPPGRPEFS